MWIVILCTIHQIWQVGQSFRCKEVAVGSFDQMSSFQDKQDWVDRQSRDERFILINSIWIRANGTKVVHTEN